jgi:radical SAM protein with 4Fe4S-binding SPASM domain
MAASSQRIKVNGFSIELTARCNQQCRYCYNAWRQDSSLHDEQKSDTASIVARVLRLMDTFEIGHFTLTGGEPFASPAVFELLDLIGKRSIAVQIISNGAMIDDAIAARLAPYRPSYVQCTLNGPDPSLHEEHTGPGQFEKTLTGIRALQKHAVRVGGCIVITRRNASRVGEILNLWQSLGVKQIALSRFSPAGYASRFAAELLPSVNDMHAALEQALPFATERGMSLHSTMPLPPCAIEVERFRGIKFGSCAIGSSMQEFALGPGGELRHCTLHRSPIGTAGDIQDSRVDLAALVASDDVSRYKEQIPEFCKGCVHAHRCAGGCGAASEWAFGDARCTPDPFLWQHVDDAYAARLGRVVDEDGAEASTASH